MWNLQFDYYQNLLWKIDNFGCPNHNELERQKPFFNLRFLYSQDLSNYKTVQSRKTYLKLFLYSQDLSNYKTIDDIGKVVNEFLYSQDLSNYKTKILRP